MKKNGSRYSKRGGGGHGSAHLNPGSYPDSVGTFGAVDAEANYAKMPNIFSSKQVGGMGYGFSNAGAALVPNMAGSYFPVSPSCTGHADASRGGNNFMSDSKFMGGGARRSKRSSSKKYGKKVGGILLNGGRRTKRRRGSRRSSKRSSSKRSSSKRSSTKTKKWWQVGCQKKMNGGLVIV